MAVLWLSLLASLFAPTVADVSQDLVIKSLASAVLKQSGVNCNFQVPYTSGPCADTTEGTLRWNFQNKQLEVCDGNQWQSVATEKTDNLGNSKDHPASGCRHALKAGSTVSGLYWLQPPGVSQPFQAYCDQTTDGGGWMLLYAYKHIGGQNVPLAVGLPTDPNGYSHQLLSNLGIGHGWVSELRFYCTTSAHNRVMHFKTSNANVLAAAYDGKRHFTVDDWRTSSSKLSGHSARLPDATANVWATAQATPGFTDFPFWKAGTYHWGIAPYSKRFECDDYPGNNRHNTLHRVFVRG